MDSSNNDALIEDLRTKIEKRYKELGTKPTKSLITNAIIELEGNPKPININTLTLTKAKKLLRELLLIEFSNELLKKKTGYDLNEGIKDYITDLTTIINKLSWQEEKQKLTAMDKQLEDLLSQKAKTQNTINQITKELNL